MEILLVYLDDYHLGDPLYVPSMARMMGRLRVRPRCLLMHGGGEHVERVLEAEGIFPERHQEVIEPRTPDEAVLIERAVRQVNRRIVGTLTDEVVHAVGFQGMDRGLLRRDASGRVQAGQVDWLKDLVLLGAVPVVSTLVHDEKAACVREIALSEAVLTLAVALGKAVTVAVLTRTDQPGLPTGDGPRATVDLAEVPPRVLPEQAPVEALLEAGLQVFLTSPEGLFGGEIVLGTRVRSAKTA